MRAKILIWMIAILLLVTAVQGALTDKLYGYYSMDDTNTSGSTHYDLKGSEDLTISGATNTTGKVGTSMYFDGGSDMVQDTSYADINYDPGAISFWINTTTGSKGVLSHGGGGYPQNILWINLLANGTLRLGVNDYAGVQSYFDTINTWTDGTWHHFVVQKVTGDDLYEIWVDGVNESTTYTNDGPNLWWDVLAITYFKIGVGYPNTDYFTGQIDEVGIWNDELNSTEIATLYNSGSGCAYPFTSCSGGATTDVDFTITDQWNGSPILSFDVDVSWSNGTTTTHTTTNGTVSLINITSGAINVTYYDMTNYFNQTISDTLTENVSNTVTTNTYQAVLCLNATEKVSGDWVTADNFTIGTNTTSSCFNITAGSHNVQAQKSGWFPKNQTVTVTALSNATQTIQNLSYANLTIYAIDGNTNTSLSGYNLTILSLNHSGWTGETASAVTNHSAYLINGTYNVTISMPGYAVTYSQANITVNGATNYTFTLYLSNSVSITIRDEITNDIITENVTVRWSDNTTTWENVINTGTLFVSNITAGNYTLLFYSTNYSTRTYSLTVGPSSHQFLTAYMISSTYSTIFTIKDIDTGSILDGVSITMYKLINSTWTTVESKLTDISGKAQFYYDPIANYRFYLSKSAYQDYVFYLNPILFSTYDVYMTRESVLNYSVDFDDISFIYSPTSFDNNQNTTLNFLISSPSGQLTDYGISVTYPGGNDTDSGVNAIGEQLSVWVNITNATWSDMVTLHFNYTTSLAGTRTYTFTLPINVNVTGGTWMTVKNRTYGLGIFERMLIATIIIIFIVGIATMVGQALPGVALGMFVYGFLVFIGFVPLWAILPSMLIGVLFLIWKSGGY